MGRVIRSNGLQEETRFAWCKKSASTIDLMHVFQTPEAAKSRTQGRPVRPQDPEGGVAECLAAREKETGELETSRTRYGAVCDGPHTQASRTTIRGQLRRREAAEYAGERKNGRVQCERGR
ncbi:hypothetical protein NDU88_005739 [Pleurodeles waltl]|uniref:Uncharacterized protein n=1 Tax=Pleurodeles waltl TaxID=8319 RepID=A0AAV7TY09_PLEWA|nr:hypothetical protein NDU88_005739 [Pleurodeles waltl]